MPPHLRRGIVTRGPEGLPVRSSLLACRRPAQEAALVARGGPRLLLRGPRLLVRGLLLLLLGFTGAMGARAAEAPRPTGADPRPVPPAGATAVRPAALPTGATGAALCHGLDEKTPTAASGFAAAADPAAAAFVGFADHLPTA